MARPDITGVDEHRPALPRPDSLVARALSAPVRALDPSANAVTDAINAAVPWLWWPLAVPDPGEPLPPAAHALYAAHALVLHAGARKIGVPAAASVALALAGWAVFTGAWDRRAARA